MSLLVKARREGRDIVTVTPQSAGWRYVGFSAHRLAAGSGPATEGDESSAAGAVELGQHGDRPPVVDELDQRGERILI